MDHNATALNRNILTYYLLGKNMTKVQCCEISLSILLLSYASKSVWMYVTRCTQPLNCDVQFYVEGKLISFVIQYTHLGHTISENMNDRHDIVNVNVNLYSASLQKAPLMRYSEQEEFSLWKIK